MILHVLPQGERCTIYDDASGNRCVNNADWIVSDPDGPTILLLCNHHADRLLASHTTATCPNCSCRFATD